MTDQLKKLYTYSDLAELKKIEMVLNANQIRFMVRSYEDTAYDGIYTLTKGKGDILVFEKDFEQAVYFLKEENIL